MSNFGLLSDDTIDKLKNRPRRRWWRAVPIRTTTPALVQRFKQELRDLCHAYGIQITGGFEDEIDLCYWLEGDTSPTYSDPVRKIEPEIYRTEMVEET